MNENMKLWSQWSAVPKEAQKTITGGRMNGFTDINPVWRLRELTEKFGIVGVGWFVNIVNQRVEEGANGEKAAFVDIELFVKVDGEWSKPICGVGGSMYITAEKNGLRTSDEAFKMAYTDAISVACKQLGIGADVYWQAGATKYTTAKQTAEQKKTEEAPKYRCQKCKAEITFEQADKSKHETGYVLCDKCVELYKTKMKEKEKENEGN